MTTKIKTITFNEKKEDKLYVNLFIPSEVGWDEKKAFLTQITNFPEEASTELIWNSKKGEKRFHNLVFWLNSF